MMPSTITLWKISKEYQQLIDQLYDYETGEVNMEVQSRLDELEPSIEKKCIAITSWIRKMQSEERELENLMREVIERRDAYKNKINKCSEYLETNMERCGIKEVKCPYFTIRLKKNPYSTEIVDESLIPKEFMKTREIVKIETKPDKNAIKEEFLKGNSIPGANVTQKNKLEILINKI